MGRSVVIFAILLTFFSLSMLPMSVVRATTISGTYTGVGVTYSSQAGPNGLTFYHSGGNLTYLVGRWVGHSTYIELDMVYSNGSGTCRGIETFDGSFDGSPPGSITGMYTCTLTPSGYAYGPETYSGGSFGLRDYK